MTNAIQPNQISGATKFKLALAWAFVSVPLIWGVLNTLERASQLFR
ncbi:MAG: oxalate:formate antiporter [Pseudomonadota bacterium]